jgi:hypothetical protein
LASNVIKNNDTTVTEYGLVKTKYGYIFKGNVDNNYVSFSGRIFRIMEVYNDNSVKVVSNDNQALLIWGEESDYKTSNVYNWINKTDKEHSGIYHNTIPGKLELLTDTSWCSYVLSGDEVSCSDKKEDSLFSILSIEDYTKALGKNSYLNNETYTYLLGYDEDNSNLVVSDEGVVESVSNYEGYGIRVVFTFKKNIEIIGGVGTINDPYILNQEGHKNMVNSYVNLGNDTYLVYEENNDVLRLQLNNYIHQLQKQYLRVFSDKNAEFDPLYRYNIAYYLNNDYYYSLAYKDNLIDCDFAIGEISNESGLDYENIYKKYITSKIGLMN